MIDQSWYVRLPHITRERTSAGGVVVRAERGEPLVALAREKSYAGPVLPKGGVEAGESLEQTARREIEEEAGLSRLTLVMKLGVLERLSFDKQQWITTHVFFFTTDQRSGIPTDHARHKHGPLWRRLDDLGDMFWPDQRQLIHDHAELIRRHVGAAATHA
jgi:8-oxo-dGTP pyrophosphatase MutT (NUDIX family)